MSKRQRSIVCGLCGLEKDVWAEDWTKEKFAVRMGWSLDDQYKMLCPECVVKVAEERVVLKRLRMRQLREGGDNTAYFIAPDGSTTNHIYIVAWNGAPVECLSAECTLQLIEAAKDAVEILPKIEDWDISRFLDTKAPYETLNDTECAEFILAQLATALKGVPS